MDLALKVVAFTALATSLGVFATDSGPFVKMISVLAPVASMCSLLAGLAALHKGQPSARIFVFASLVFQFGLTAYGLRALDLVPSNALTSYGIQWGSVIEMMLLSLALADRIQALRHEKERAQAEALRARRSAVEALQDAEKRLEDRIAERTAELARANEHLLASQRELSRLALHDGLTGLANRAHLEEQLLLAVARCRRAGTGCAVLLIDLDGFKAVNDTRGHAVGDALLKSVAVRLRSQVRASDLVARVGGDEFVVVFEPAETEALAVSLSRKLLDALGKPHGVADEVFTVGASIGITLVPAHGTEPKELLEQADRAMYEAKRRGKGCFEVARPVA
jgi:diguanylate cyclase (GGDEF)-like protein